MRGERRKIWRKGERINHGETWTMTLKIQAKNRTAGGNSGLSEAYNLNVIKGRSVEEMMDS